jgi:heme-degrading monooxygenase HmoA
MIARQWSARATADNAARYAQYFRATLTPHLRGLAGYRGATVLERDAETGVEIVVITWWASMDAIRAFAGDDVAAAVVSDEARALLSDSDPRVDHYRVSLDDEG